MNVSVVWLRRDLRLIDNEAVAKAAAADAPCLYIFTLDPWFFKQAEIGWLRVKFLFESLAALDAELRKKGSQLIILSGSSSDVIVTLLEHLSRHGYIPTLYFNHDIQVMYGRERDQAIVKYCQDHNLPHQLTHNFFLLDNESDMPDWWRRYYKYQEARQYAAPQFRPANKQLLGIVRELPHINPQQIAEHMHMQLPRARQSLFAGGEIASHQAVYTFLKDRVSGYRWKISRPYLAQQGATSLLGPHLAFGTISSRTVFQAAINHQAKLEKRLPKKAFDIAAYLDRLRWRDSFTQRLWFHPELSWQNRFPEFDEIYVDSPLQGRRLEYFERWKNGETGFPLLDAAMIQLKHDGFINFRMRAMAATFLTINCQVSWHHGARHFMNCLVDGDVAINHWQWQMQAGITNPLSPTFRMYSPTKNFRDRDSQANYVHFWLPDTRGQTIDTILQSAKPMLNFDETRKQSGKIVSDLRKTTRERIIAEKGIELDNAEAARRTVLNYGKYSKDRYKKYIA